MISVLVIIACIVIMVRDGMKYAWEDRAESLFLGLTLGLFLSLLVYCGAQLLAPAEWHETENYGLISLCRESETGGSFVLGCGNIETARYYFGYAVKADGGYYLEKFPAEEVTFYEKPVSTGKVHVYQMEVINPWIYTFLPSIPQETKYVLEIPLGSIIQEYQP